MFWKIGVLKKFVKTTERHLKKCQFFSRVAGLASVSKHPWLIRTRTFNVERTTIFILSFCVGLATQFHGSASGLLKHHYITKIIRELLIGNSRFLIHILLNRLLYHTYIKESCLFVTGIVKTLDLNN